MSTSEFYAGMRVIGDAITEAASEKGAKGRVSIQWNAGLIAPAGPPPDTVELEASTERASTRVIFSREQLEDSADRIDRPEVLAIVRDIVARLAGH